MNPDCEIWPCVDRREATARIAALEARLKEMSDIFREVVRISDRNHPAWDKARAFFAKYPENG
jgi:hypothetical protein